MTREEFLNLKIRDHFFVIVQMQIYLCTVQLLGTDSIRFYGDAESGEEIVGSVVVKDAGKCHLTYEAANLRAQELFRDHIQLLQTRLDILRTMEQDKETK